MNHQYIIYKHTNLISKKSYIGFTSKTLAIRLLEHFRDSLNPDVQRAFQNALRKYPTPTWISEIIDVAETEQQAKELEIRAIKNHETLAPNGYNMTIGGDGFVGGQHKSESKAKTSLKLRGKKKTYVNARKGVKLSEGHLLALRKPRSYKVITEEKFRFIKDNLDRMSLTDIANQLDTDISTVKRWAIKDEFKKDKRDSSSRRIITLEQYQIIQNNLSLSNKKLSELVGLSVCMVKKWRNMEW